MLFWLYLLNSLSCVIKFIFQMRLVNVSSRSLEVDKFFFAAFAFVWVKLFKDF